MKTITLLPGDGIGPEVTAATVRVLEAAGVAAGDLLQGGSRIVVLFRDQGEPGRLDRADLVFDYFKGARVRRLDDVFHEEGGLVLDWASTRPERPGG